MHGYSFTDRNRRVLQVAGDEAAALHHDYIGTEHIVLALLRDRDSAAAGILSTLGCDSDGIRAKIAGLIKKGTSSAPAGEQRPHTLRAKKVLEFAMTSARDDGTTSVGTQHLLLGLLREEKGVAAQVLVHAGVTVGDVTVALGSARSD